MVATADASMPTGCLFDTVNLKASINTKTEDVAVVVIRPMKWDFTKWKHICRDTRDDEDESGSGRSDAWEPSVETGSGMAVTCSNIYAPD